MRVVDSATRPIVYHFFGVCPGRAGLPFRLLPFSVTQTCHRIITAKVIEDEKLLSSMNCWKQDITVNEIDVVLEYSPSSWSDC